MMRRTNPFLSRENLVWVQVLFFTVDEGKGFFSSEDDEEDESFFIDRESGLGSGSFFSVDEGKGFFSSEDDEDEEEDDDDDESFFFSEGTRMGEIVFLSETAEAVSDTFFSANGAGFLFEGEEDEDEDESDVVTGLTGSGIGSFFSEEEEDEDEDCALFSRATGARTPVSTLDLRYPR